MNSALKSIVEKGTITDSNDLEQIKKVVSDAMQSEIRKASARKFLFELNQCDTIERVQRLTYNAYLKHNGMAVLK